MQAAGRNLNTLLRQVHFLQNGISDHSPSREDYRHVAAELAAAIEAVTTFLHRYP
jgi:hypothetical protein